MRRSLNAAASALRAGGIPECRVEAEVLLRHVLRMERSEFLALVYGGDVGLSDNQLLHLQSLINRRLSGEPLAYIVGRREFYGLDLRVTGDVLIPRQETELMVDIALEYLAGSDSPSPIVVDAGTGSGALALAIAAYAETANLVATDISRDALEVARRNAIRLGLSDRIEFVHADMLSPIAGSVRACTGAFSEGAAIGGSEPRPIISGPPLYPAIDVIVSNPPYIPSDDIQGLAVEVRREPRIALDGGEDGLDPLRRLLAQAESRLAPDGVIIVELMPEQMDRAGTIAVETMGHDIEVTTHKDLMGNDRALVVERKNRNKNESSLPADAAFHDDLGQPCR